MVTLIVDDLPIVADETAKIVQQEDPQGSHTVVYSAADALKRVEELKPDIVWLDVEMPGQNGLKLAAKIKKISPGSNIVFVSGHAEYALDAHRLHVSGYILKPVTRKRIREEIDNLRLPLAGKSGALLKLRCFGNFEAFTPTGEAVSFSRRLEKEALAYLADRQGSVVDTGWLCGVLWESDEMDNRVKAHCRQIMSSLRKDLAAAGAEAVLIKAGKGWRIDTELVDCDYYRFLEGDAQAVNLFAGEYMSQYSWAEVTLGGLLEHRGEEH